MKRIITNLGFITFIAALFVFLYGYLGINPDTAGTQTVRKNTETVLRVNEMIETARQISSFDNVSIFSLSEQSFDIPEIVSNIGKSSNLKINSSKLTELYSDKKSNINFIIPVNKIKNLELELKEVELLTPDFKMSVNSGYGKHYDNYNKGRYFRGIVKGESNSVAAVSIFDNMVMGVISCNEGTFNLGPVKDANSTYILYNDKDLKVNNNFKCGIDDTDMKLYKTGSNPITKNGQSDYLGARLPVKIYIEADYQLYTDKGSVTSVTNFVTGYYNSVATLYQNEFIPINISEISVWDTPDPYRNIQNSMDYLYAFGVAKKDNFNGDLAQFLTSRNLGAGGIAWVGTLCTSFNANDSSGRFSFCDIDLTYNVYPSYSWTVMVSTHELGHNFGSMHTHACWWPVSSNQRVAIDSCYYAEGGCFSGTQAAIGTIMSYCHLQVNYGGAIDPRLGFGPLPGDTIRLRYNQCSKFGPVINSSEVPTIFSMAQNFPNPFNPSTTIRFTVPENANVTIQIYDLTGREVASLLNGVFRNIGVYNVPFNASMYSLSSGVYFYRITANDPASNAVKFTEVKRMILIK
jgi:hypothetical protein